MDLSYYMTKEQGEVVNQWIDLYIEQCGLKNKTPYEAAKEVHDYIKATFTYDRDSYNIFESLISQKANGYVISMLNCLILNKLDIPTRITYGDHLWNSTQIDGVWYYTDIVWDMYDPKNSNFLVLPNVYNESRIATNGFIPTN